MIIFSSFISKICNKNQYFVVPHLQAAYCAHDFPVGILVLQDILVLEDVLVLVDILVLVDVA